MFSPTFGRLLRALLVAVFLAPGAILHADTDRAVLDGFMKRMREHDATCEELAAKLLKIQGGGVVLIRAVAAKVKAIDTAGLPEDLQQAFREFVDSAQVVSAVFKGFPEKPEEIVVFMQRQIAANPNYQREMSAKNAPAMQAMGKAIAKVDEVGRKYGLAGLGDLLQ